MTRLFFLLLSLIMTTLAGIGVIAVPVAWLVARKLENLD